MDVVVTVPKKFGLDAWIDEGDPAGTEWTGKEWHFYIPSKPTIQPGERVYVVYAGKLRGYAPLVRLERGWWHTYCEHDRQLYLCKEYFALVRHGEAVAVTVPFEIKGFRGFRYCWWDRAVEVPFQDWMKP